MRGTGAFAVLTGDRQLEGLDLGRALFLDVETTGLGGGAGTYVFLVGRGRWLPDDGRVELRQDFLTGPEEERELLAETARRIGEAEAVVTFFGKAFDRWRLEDKMRVHGIEPPFEGKPHLDLYHPLRRVHRGRFGDSRLQTLERALLGFHRPDDLPGAQAPAAWLAYLEGRPHELERVFEHNAHDVLSLVELAFWLACLEDGCWPSGEPLPLPPGGRGLRALAFARGHRDRREWSRALRWYDEALAELHPLDPLRGPALVEAARTARRCDPVAAEQLFARILAEAGEARCAQAWLVAGLEAGAIFHERDRRSPAAAARFCEAALGLLAGDRARREAFARRAARLARQRAGAAPERERGRRTAH